MTCTPIYSAYLAGYSILSLLCFAGVLLNVGSASLFSVNRKITKPLTMLEKSRIAGLTAHMIRSVVGDHPGVIDVSGYRARGNCVKEIVIPSVLCSYNRPSNHLAHIWFGLCCPRACRKHIIEPLVIYKLKFQARDEQRHVRW